MFEPLLAQIKYLQPFAAQDLLAWWNKESDCKVYDLYVHICNNLFTALILLDTLLTINGNIITHTETFWLENNDELHGNTLLGDGATYFGVKFHNIYSIEKELTGGDRN